MKTISFKYLKEKSKDPKEYEVYVLAEDESSNYGIALNYLNEDEKTELKQVVENYEAALKPFISKAYRHFKKENIISE